MNNNLIIKNARIITPLGTSALKGKEMNQLLRRTGNCRQSFCVRQENWQSR